MKYYGTSIEKIFAQILWNLLLSYIYNFTGNKQNCFGNSWYGVFKLIVMVMYESSGERFDSV
jgi:hypothetical protein